MSRYKNIECHISVLKLKLTKNKSFKKKIIAIKYATLGITRALNPKYNPEHG